MLTDLADDFMGGMAGPAFSRKELEQEIIA